MSETYLPLITAGDLLICGLLILLILIVLVYKK
jgi:hypothetical protein